MSNHSFHLGVDFAAEDDIGTLWKLEGVKLWSIDVGWSTTDKAKYDSVVYGRRVEDFHQSAMKAMPVIWAWTFPTETPASRAMFDGIRSGKGLLKEAEYAGQRYRDTGEFRWLRRAVKLAFLSGWREHTRPEGPLRLRGLYR